MCASPPMRLATWFGVVLMVIPRGASSVVGDSSDKVAISATGTLNRHSQIHKRNEAVPNDSPFVLDTTPENPMNQKAMPAPATIPYKENSPFEVDDSSVTPFEIDPGPAGMMGVVSHAGGASDIQSGMNDSPFVLDNEASPSSQAIPTASSSAADSPFVFESAGGAGSPVATAAASAAASPFVFETQVDEKSESKLQGMDQVAQSGHLEPSRGKAKFTIVKNGNPITGPQPATTSVVMAYQFQTSTHGPTTSGPLRFELGGAMLEVHPGQKFVSIPDTPFEMESHLALKHAYRAAPKAQIELLRPGIIQPVGLVATSQGSSRLPLNVEAPMAVIATPHSAKRLMRNEDMHSSFAEVGSTQRHARELQPNILPIAAAMPGSMLHEDLTETVINDASPPMGAALADVEAARVASGAVPSSAQNALNAPAITQAQDAEDTKSLTPAPVDNPDNSSLSAPGAVFNKTVRVAGAQNLTTTNVTRGTNAERTVTAKGAFISILLGLLVTVFFLSIVLCFLRAGEKEPSPKEQSEDPVFHVSGAPTRSSYRQVLRAQEAEASQAVSSVISTPTS